jgi:hypothetical protein
MRIIVICSSSSSILIDSWILGVKVLLSDPLSAIPASAQLTVSEESSSDRHPSELLGVAGNQVKSHDSWSPYLMKKHPIVMIA